MAGLDDLGGLFQPFHLGTWSVKHFCVTGAAQVNKNTHRKRIQPDEPLGWRHRRRSNLGRLKGLMAPPAWSRWFSVLCCWFFSPSPGLKKFPLWCLSVAPVRISSDLDYVAPVGVISNVDDVLYVYPRTHRCFPSWSPPMPSPLVSKSGPNKRFVLVGSAPGPVAWKESGGRRVTRRRIRKQSQQGRAQLLAGFSDAVASTAAIIIPFFFSKFRPGCPSSARLQPRASRFSTPGTFPPFSYFPRLVSFRFWFFPSSHVCLTPVKARTDLFLLDLCCHALPKSLISTQIPSLYPNH